MHALGLDPRLALWLIAADEESILLWSGDGKDRAPSQRYRQSASAQKIFYDAGSVTDDLLLEDAFEKLGVAAPTVDQARTVFESVNVPRYRFDVDGDLWHVRNVSKPAWDDPFAGRAWILFARTPESRTIRLPLEGREVKDALAWLPLLDGHHGTEEVDAAAARSPAGKRLLAALRDIDALYLADEEPFRIAALPPLLFVSHSSVFVRGSAASILIDPAIQGSTEMLSSEGRRPFEIASHVDAVLVSHCHWDHLSLQTVLRIPRTTKMIVPRTPTPALVNPPIATYLRALGFSDVDEVGDWDTRTIGDVEVTFVPFFGEPFGLASRFDAFTYLVRASGKTIYGSLDACHDEAGDMNPVIERIAKEHRVDVFLFGSSNQQHDPIYRGANMRHYSNELLRRPDLVRYHPNVDDVVRWTGMLAPKAIVPYANFVYFGATTDDERLGAPSNVDRYWAALEGRPLPPTYTPWRSEIDRLRSTVAPSLLMLHPMQGLRF
jgi:L-ascorbate metabolism protein UlaG (beta-lactamase superfamily)